MHLSKGGALKNFDSVAFAPDNVRNIERKGEQSVKVPLVDLKAGFEPIKERFFEGVRAALDSMQLFLGPNIRALEEEFARFCGARHAMGTSCGTSALHLSLLATGVGPGDEVIIPSYSFYATAEAVVHAGATPVFADIDPKTLCLDPADVQRQITPRTRAIMPVHFAGQTADMKALAQIAHKHNLRLIEDACQAHGAACRGVRAGALGHIAGFSFYFTKNMGGYGEGGMVTTSDDAFAERVRLYRHHGHVGKFDHEVIGYNYRMDELQAVALRLRLERLAANNESRRRAAALYTAALKDIKQLKLPAEAEGNYHVYHLYAIQCAQRDALNDFLNANGVGTGIHYKNPIHLQKPFRAAGWKKGDLPVTEGVTERILSLPMYPELTEEQVGYVAGQVREFFKT